MSKSNGLSDPLLFIGSVGALPTDMIAVSYGLISKIRFMLLSVEQRLFAV